MASGLDAPLVPSLCHPEHLSALEGCRDHRQYQARRSLLGPLNFDSFACVLTPAIPRISLVLTYWEFPIDFLLNSIVALD